MPLKNGQPWTDTNGQLIHAHGGGVLLHDGVYYWYGEDKNNPTHQHRHPTGWMVDRTDIIGMHAYSSRDLQTWRDEGVVLPAVPEPGHPLHPSRVAERPKVLFNHQTRKFVLWFHSDDPSYLDAMVGVATADHPTGPFTFHRAFRPNEAESRDCTVFQDDDGTAYLLNSSENNKTLHIQPLTDDYLSLAGPYTRHFIDESREAPTIFKARGHYYLITSGCTGWDPNPAMIARAPRLTGPWENLGNPCRGPRADITFGGQCTHAFTTREGQTLVMADVWVPRDLRQSGHIRLPITWEGDLPTLVWRDEA